MSKKVSLMLTLKEREWKQHKLTQANDIKKLEKLNNKLIKVVKSHEQ